MTHEHQSNLRVLIVYGTTGGHTRKVAQMIGDTLADGGVNADVVAAGEAGLALQPYAGIIVAASVHAGQYQKAVVEWLRARSRDFGDRPTAFVSVCLGVLQKDDPKVAADLDAIVQRFKNDTGWQPASVTQVAGALLYTRYNFFTRWIMKRIVRKAGGDTDTSRDYEYTNWDDVRAFAGAFGRLLSARASHVAKAS